MRTVQLKDIAQIIMGQSPPGNSYNDNRVGLPLLNGAADYKGQQFTPQKYTTKPTKITQKDDLLMGIRATIGNFAISDREYCIGRGVVAIRVDEQSANKKYVLNVIEQKLVDFLNISAGSTIKGIRKEDLTDLVFPLPSLQIQNKIVEVIDEAKSLLQKRKQTIDLLDEYMKSVFLEMFGDPIANPKGWNCLPLDKVCDEIYRYPTFYGFEYVEKGMPVIKIGNILRDGIVDPDLNNYDFISDEVNSHYPRTIIEPYDILMAVRGDGSTVKRVGMVKSQNLVGGNISPNLLRFKTNKNILLPHYFFALITSPQGQAMFERYITQTAKKTITAKDIKTIVIPIPPLDIQNKYTSIVQNAELVKQKMLKQSQELDNQFQALMQKYFSSVN